MRITHSAPQFLVIAAGFALLAPLSVAQSTATPAIIDRVQSQVLAFMSDLANLLCRETVVQEKYLPNGHMQAIDRSEYDYFVMLEGDPADLQLTESRTETSAMPHRIAPLLVTSGFSTLLLVFHPYYQNSFEFDVGSAEVQSGQVIVPIRFKHVTGQKSPAVLASGDRDYPLELQGTAWVDEQTGQIIKIQAALAHDMSDIGLKSMNVQVQYETSDRGKDLKPLVLPAKATVDVQTPHHHWHNAHFFSHYRMFSTSAVQDPNVILRPSHSANTTAAPPQTTPDQPNGSH